MPPRRPPADRQVADPDTNGQTVDGERGDAEPPDSGPDRSAVEDGGSASPPRICRADGCLNLLSDDAPTARRFCDDHQPKPGTEPETKAKGTGRPRGRPPGSTNRSSTVPKAEELARVEQSARTIVEMGAGFLFLAATQANKPLLAADCLDIQAGAPRIAQATRNLAIYEPGLRRILAAGKTSDRGQAWIQFGITLGVVALPILVRHQIVPADLQQMVDQMTAMGEQALTLHDQPGASADAATVGTAA